MSPSPHGVEELADAVASAVVAVPGVHALHGGMFGEVATYLPGRRLAGVRLDADHVDVHVVMEWGQTVGELARAVQDTVGDVAPGRQVSVTVEDVAATTVDGDEQDASDVDR